VDRAHTPPPLPGEHTDAILREAGMSPEEIEAMRREGAIG
jgi:crotonobetainyl-CoA:carnitine CoA-transferase CaiB-like acyl-CoA transferase